MKIPFKLGGAEDILDAWGRPEDIGATTVEGPIEVSGKFLIGSPDSPVFGGLYAATRGVYTVTYPFHEHATLMAGELAITDESTGKTTVYGPGDSWLIAKGTPVRWDIRSAAVRKSYIATTVDL